MKAAREMARNKVVCTTCYEITPQQVEEEDKGLWKHAAEKDTFLLSPVC